ncbi:alpha/beta hydrolase [Streptomyces sp. NPDC053474]|uniref:alpha/beta hydrolase n=1 Tax=Streptomyces sp. NPDC053474 TaxID=3365704 RepID=UPI0037D4BA97
MSHRPERPAAVPVEYVAGPGGHRLCYRDHGPALLALHGHFTDGRTFTPLARALAGRQPRLVRALVVVDIGAARARDMARRRARVRLVELDTGHTVHETDPEGFAGAVGGFLAGL